MITAAQIWAHVRWMDFDEVCEGVFDLAGPDEPEPYELDGVWWHDDGIMCSRYRPCPGHKTFALAVRNRFKYLLLGRLG